MTSKHITVPVVPSAEMMAAGLSVFDQVLPMGEAQREVMQETVSAVYAAMLQAHAAVVDQAVSVRPATAHDAEVSRTVSLAGPEIAQAVSDLLQGISGESERLGFMLIILTAPWATYLSNCGRDQMIGLLEQLLVRFRSGAPDVPAHLKGGH